jgi:hypothetical protein
VLRVLDQAREATSPTLVVVDDADKAAAGLPAVMGDFERVPVLVFPRHRPRPGA